MDTKGPSFNPLNKGALKFDHNRLGHLQNQSEFGSSSSSQLQPPQFSETNHSGAAPNNNQNMMMMFEYPMPPNNSGYHAPNGNVYPITVPSGNYHYKYSYSNNEDSQSEAFSPSPTFGSAQQNSDSSRRIKFGGPGGPDLLNSSTSHKPKFNLGDTQDFNKPRSNHTDGEKEQLVYDMESCTYKSVKKSEYDASPKLQQAFSPTHSRNSTSSSPGHVGDKPKRSRNGCLTCRRRKKKCCETRPTCSECARLLIRCRWPVPGSERRNRSKNNQFNPDEMKHEWFGTIKILRGVVDYKVEE